MCLIALIILYLAALLTRQPCRVMKVSVLYKERLCVGTCIRAAFYVHLNFSSWFRFLFDFRDFFIFCVEFSWRLQVARPIHGHAPSLKTRRISRLLIGFGQDCWDIFGKRSCFQSLAQTSKLKVAMYRQSTWAKKRASCPPGRGTTCHKIGGRGPQGPL